jgi:hypothetical protein
VRITSLVGFLGSMLALLALVGRQMPEARIPTGLIFAFSPFGMLFSRAGLVEWFAVCFALLAVLVLDRWQTEGRARWLLLGVVLGSLAATVKVTTAVVWLLPALPLLSRPLAARLTAAGIPILMAALWAAYADRIKAQGEITQYLTGAGAVTWVFGTLAQRLDGGAWLRLIAWLIPWGLLGLLPIGLLRDSPARRLALWFGLTALLGPVVFMNLYVVHSYYAAAISPAIAGLGGMGVALAWRRRPRRMVSAIATAVVLVTTLATVREWAFMFAPVWDPEGILPLARDLNQRTASTDLLFLAGRDWNPAILMYADRRGVAKPTDLAIGPPAGYRVFVCPEVGEPGPCVEDAAADS